MKYVHIPLKYVCLLVLNTRKPFILIGDTHSENNAVADL